MNTLDDLVRSNYLLYLSLAQGISFNQISMYNVPWLTMCLHENWMHWKSFTNLAEKRGGREKGKNWNCQTLYLFSISDYYRTDWHLSAFCLICNTHCTFTTTTTWRFIYYIRIFEAEYPSQAWFYLRSSISTPGCPRWESKEREIRWRERENFSFQYP